jgi:AraC family transcriptional regulator, transcriptional activator of pobA
MTRMSKVTPGRVPRYALYGSDAPSAWQGAVHFERIHERSSVHDYEIQPHVHDALVQVFHVERGTGEAVIDAARWALRAPCLVVVPARTVHAFRFSTDIDGPVVTAAQRPLESLAAAASPALLETFRRPVVLPLADTPRHAEALPPLFAAIERETRLVDAGPGDAGVLLLATLFVQLGRIGASLATGAGDAPMRSRQAARIEGLRTLVDAHFRERWPIQRYAAALGLTPGQLTRVCREALGRTSLDLVNARVVHEAQRELVYASLSVKQVAALLGFDDEAYFSRYFRKHVGQSPSDFRAAARLRPAAPR